MNLDKKKFEIIKPKNRLHLYSYEKNFDDFIKMYKSGKLPNTILLSGPKGSGKATFVYHFVNYLFSDEKNDNYDLKKFSINPNNQSFLQIQNNTHPNFYLLENEFFDTDIKIEQVRNLKKFLYKSTYLKNVKIVLIDDAEKLNINSSNALLKVLEEPSKNTFFFIVFDNFLKIPDTIKSRCLEFKFYLNFTIKKNIFNNLLADFDLNANSDIIDKFIQFETPGNLLRHLLLLEEFKINITEDYLSCILFLLEKSKNKKDLRLINFVSLLIELYYNDLALKDNKNLNIYSNNKNKILYLIYNAKKFNLDKKNLFISIENLLTNETK